MQKMTSKLDKDKTIRRSEGSGASREAPLTNGPLAQGNKYSTLLVVIVLCVRMPVSIRFPKTTPTTQVLSAFSIETIEPIG